jgi:hypothetical protein
MPSMLLSHSLDHDDKATPEKHVKVSCPNKFHTLRVFTIVKTLDMDLDPFPSPSYSASPLLPPVQYQSRQKA